MVPCLLDPDHHCGDDPEPLPPSVGDYDTRCFGAPVEKDGLDALFVVGIVDSAIGGGWMDDQESGFCSGKRPYPVGLE